MSWVRKTIYIVLGLAAALVAISAVRARSSVVEPCVNIRPRVPSRMSLARRSMISEE